MLTDWVGSKQTFLDEIAVSKHHGIITGRYGGSTASGAIKNEDGLLAMQDEAMTWSLAVLLDAHHRADSAELVVAAIKKDRTSLAELLEQDDAFFRLEEYFVSLFTSPEFTQACHQLSGETSCLIVFQKKQFLWWLSIGDCMAYLLHPDLAQFGQFALNQRQFYEWVGKVNTFDLDIPCYTVGRRQLRPGMNHIVLMTDGVLDTADRYFHNAQNLYDVFMNGPELDVGVRAILHHVHAHKVRDSATIICWSYHNAADALMSSDFGKL
ncbi:protein phosphatase 2C domain-containing protein [Paenibacillus medicaginis]|uniref:Protein phosphatase 2C domain-containing protein n=1 Tax=Paenibacillus medicaginis TaxID=1470560 RepID=A0ABV5BY30_9BACL